MTVDELIAALEREAATLISAASTDFEAAIPACPGWDVRTLVVHLGRVHRWATAALQAGGSAPAGFPARPDELTDTWFADGVNELADVLRTVDPDAPAWTFLGPGTTRFWARRQALETAVHRWDVEDAIGGATPVDAELAVAGVDEVLDVFLPRRLQGDEPPTLPAGSLHIHATDDDHGEWIIRSHDGELLVGHGHEKGDAAVRGPAGDLLLWLWGRLDLDALEVFGDAGVARDWAGLHAV